jgi:hypothetical protein
MVFALAFCVFFSHPAVPITDSYYSLLMSESILTRHTVALDGYGVPHLKPFAMPGFGANGYPYQVTFARGRMLYAFPHGTPLLSVPLVAALNLCGLQIIDRQAFFRMPKSWPSGLSRHSWLVRSRAFSWPPGH